MQPKSSIAEAHVLLCLQMHRCESHQRMLLLLEPCISYCCDRDLFMFQKRQRLKLQCTLQSLRGKNLRQNDYGCAVSKLSCCICLLDAMCVISWEWSSNKQAVYEQANQHLPPMRMEVPTNTLATGQLTLGSFAAVHNICFPACPPF